MRALLAAVPLVTACAGYAQLDPKKVTAVAVTTADGSGAFCAGAPPVQLKAIATVEGGRRYATWEQRDRRRTTDGRLRFASFQWSADGARVDGDGYLVASDLLATLDAPIRVRASVIGRDAVAGEAAIAPRFDCGVAIDLSGRAGDDGMNGSDGSSGSSGSSGDDDSSGGDGGRGGDGDDGKPGERGAPGPALDVAIGVVATAQQRLALVRVTVTGGTEPPRYTLVALD
ncbi:MAG: hypothetical protein KIT31_40355, partial [Deltaproteobacteria bacterium]|nr:hypothetical protein [Deltaproteobacteria bacterium]